MEEAAGKGCTTGDNPEDCPVCLTNFDDIVQRPRNLPCGHTVCTLCIDKLKEQGRVTCPECRISHAVPEGGQFPVSYIAEALIRMMRDAKVATAALSPPSAGKGKEAAEAADKKEVTGFSKKMRSFLQEQEATVVAAITACREARSQLDQYQTTLTGWGERQQHLEDRLQGLVDQSRSARGLVQQEKSRTTAMEVKVKVVEQALQAMQETLRTLKTEQEAGVVVTEVFRCTGEAEQVVQECQECFPDASTVTTARKVREASSAALEAAQAVQAALETPSSVTSEEPRPLSNPAEPRPLSNPAEPRPLSDPAEPRPLSDPAEPRPLSDPAEPRPLSHPVEPRPLSDPVEPRPLSDPAEPRPLSDPVEPRPQSDPAELSSQSHPEELSSQSGSEEPRPQSASEKLQVQSDPGSTIMDRVKLILTLNLKAKDLRSLSQPALSLIQAGRVFAVHQVKGQRRLARISLEAGRLCLHTLKEQHHSLDAATLQVSWGLGPPRDTRIFVHGKDATTEGIKSLMIKANDTGVLVIAVPVLQSLQELGLENMQKESQVADLQVRRFGVADLKVRQSGVADLKVRQSGVADLKVRQSGVADLKVRQSGVADLKVRQSGVADLKVRQSGVADLKVRQSGVADLQFLEQQDSLTLQVLRLILHHGRRGLAGDLFLRASQGQGYGEVLCKVWHCRHRMAVKCQVVLRQQHLRQLSSACCLLTSG
ncbi:uncharacterized protein LOC127001053 [Eriocheir sinensis]|uniref:uncharacterized protein LOC127001053 n=1 Tax=Eriocheir sinensis TaxID=95602 RepID=UPI0021C5B7C5|nr:uncharacterized protein LOC127001053 [Eriocheir sinensis]